MKFKFNAKLLLLLCCVPLLNGCAPKDDTGNIIETNQFDIWSTYSTAKVLRNQSEKMVYTKNPANISISLMKGEKESTQLVVTAKRDINSFALVKSDLTDGFGNTLSREDISVFVQKYIKLQRKFNASNNMIFAGDEIPDMLLPIDKSIEYHENYILNGNNQGLTIDVRTYKDTVPGIYRGNFVLYLDDERIDIPVEVNVWDIDGSGKHDFKSCFLVYQNYLPAGEYSNTDELLENYDKFLLDYQVCFENINNEDKSEQGISDYIDYCMKFLAYDEYNSINIPLWYDFSNEGYNFEKALSGENQAYQTTLNITYLYFRTLLEKTTSENKLVDYTYWYASCLDEADMYPTTLLPHAIQFFKHDGDWQKTINYVVNRLLDEGYFEHLDNEYKSHALDYLRHFPVVYTNTQFGSSIDNDLIATVCPLISIYDSQSNASKLLDYANRNTNGNLWTYTCSGPVNPYPTLHIDDFLTGNRVCGWMYKKYKINGYLYWATDLYQSLGVFGSLDTIVDPYSDVERAGKVPGDGFLLYPGRYYGSSMPFATNRLMSYRDGVEDYVLLCQYEKAVKEYANRYGIEINFDELVNDLYDSLFSGTKYIQDDSLVYNARKELANRILSLKNDDHVIALKEITAEGYVLNVYSTSNKLNINGTTVNGVATTGGYYYQVVPTGNVTIETSDYMFVYEFAERGKLLDFANPNLITYSKSTNSSVLFSDNNAIIDICAEYKDKGDTIGSQTKAFKPFVDFAISSLKDFKSLSFNIENLINNRSIELSFDLVLKDGDKVNLSVIYLDKSQTSLININLQSFSEEVLSNAQKIKFSISNIKVDDGGIYHLNDNAKFSLSSIIYEK